MFDLFKTQIGQLRLLAFVEGVSFLILLFITMPLKYIFQMHTPNQIFGMVHGVLFVLYVIWVIKSKIELEWSMQKTAWALLASVVPFGTFYADAKLFRADNSNR
jgi:integral membrane protein